MSEVTNETTDQTTNQTTNQKATGGTGKAVTWACVLAYLLFFLPLVVEGDKKIHRFHANQGLVLLILTVAIMIIGVIPILGWFIGFFGGIFVLVLAIMGMVSAGKGEMKPLPIIGKINILK
jgi:uncharacterized membrane protein